MEVIPLLQPGRETKYFIHAVVYNCVQLCGSYVYMNGYMTKGIIKSTSLDGCAVKRFLSSKIWG